MDVCLYGYIQEFAFAFCVGVRVYAGGYVLWWLCPWLWAWGPVQAQLRLYFTSGFTSASCQPHQSTQLWLGTGICWGANSRPFLMKQQWSRWDFWCPHHCWTQGCQSLFSHYQQTRSRRICISNVPTEWFLGTPGHPSNQSQPEPRTQPQPEPRTQPLHHTATTITHITSHTHMHTYTCARTHTHKSCTSHTHNSLWYPVNALGTWKSA